MMHRNIIVAGALALTFVFNGGCASVAESGFHSNYERMSPGDKIERYWADRTVRREAVSTIDIAPVEVAKLTGKSQSLSGSAAQWLRSAMVKSIESKPGWRVVNLPGEAKSRLDLAITQLSPGSAGGRMFAGEFGMGHAFAQVEGKLVQRNPEREVAALADQRGSSGAIGFADLAGDAGPHLVQRILEDIAEDSADEFFASFR